MTLWSTAKTRALKSIKRLGRAYLEIPRILILIIIMAAASDVNVETTVTPVWEQICQKTEYFSMDRNRYWDVQTSLNIYEGWCPFHNIDPDEFGKRTFEVCHKIRPKIIGLHITGISNWRGGGLGYILRSIRNGLMNCGRMRCQASD